MSTGLSLLMIAAGAVLATAIDYRVAGVDIEAIGVILIVVGAIGLLYSLLFMASFAPFNRHEERIVEGRREHEHR